MEQQRSGKLKFFLVILGAIIVLHMIVLALIVNSSDKDKKTEKKTVVSPAVKKTPDRSPRKPVWRYRKKSPDPLFGKPLDHTGAIRGTFPAHLIPGDTSSAGILVDMNTRKVLWEKNSSRPVPVASMSKMMTLLLAMEYLEARPKLSLSTRVKVSKEVLALPRSGVLWLDPRETFTISEYIKCAAVKSANDAALQLALIVSGTEERFVRLMNKRAKSLNMSRTNFINAHGLPAPQGHSLSTANDMILLGERLFEYPFLMACCQTASSSIRTGDRKTVFKNSNNLLRRKFPGMEGLKTGFTRKAGFCLTFSVKRSGRRLMGCVTGFPTSGERDRFCAALIEWAYQGCPENKINASLRQTAVRKRSARKK